MRETLYSSAAALATRDLEILPVTHGESSGVFGFASMALEHVLTPAAVTAALPTSQPR
jgi:hypothetical protein